MIPFPDNKNSIIYADPPWQYTDKSKHRGGAARYYDTMSLRYICNLPVYQISHSDSVLFLWATFPMLEEALLVIKNWGFVYKTIGFVWVKTNKGGLDLDHRNLNIYMGMGHYTRSNSEICLLATRGKGLPRQDKSVSSVVVSPRQKHSKKPDEVRDRIDRLYGDVSKIELFARECVDGWGSWGLEV